MSIKKPEYMTTLEFRIVRAIVERALDKGYSVSVIDDAFGEGERVVKNSRKISEIFGALATTGSDLLQLKDSEGERVGVIALVYNGDETVVHDHSDNPEINEIAG